MCFSTATKIPMSRITPGSGVNLGYRDLIYFHFMEWGGAPVDTEGARDGALEWTAGACGAALRGGALLRAG